MRNDRFKRQAVPLEILEWRNNIVFGATILPTPLDQPTTIGIQPGGTLAKLQQDDYNIQPGWYRAYFGITSNQTDWDFFITLNDQVILVVNGYADFTYRSYIDFYYSEPLPPNDELAIVFQGQDDTYEWQLHFFRICPKPEFDPKQHINFQLPMYCISENKLETDSGCLGIPKLFEALHTGIVTDDQTQTPFFPNTIHVQQWDNIFINFPVGYQGGLFFKYAIDSGNVAWSTPFDNSQIKAVTLVVANNNVGFGFPFQHDNNIDPLENLSGCWYSDVNIADPIVDPGSSLYIGGLYEEDSSTVPSTGRVQYQFENIFMENYAMRVEYTILAEDAAYYHLYFELVNTTSLRVTILDSAGAVIVVFINEGRVIDKIFNTGLLPVVDKNITIRIEYFDVVDCDSPGWNDEMICNVQLYRVQLWDALLEENNNTCTGDFIEYLNTSVITRTEAFGESYSPNVLYSYDLTTLVEGCYSVRIVDFDTDISRIITQYISQCLRICDSAPSLCYVYWNNPAPICVGKAKYDQAVYKLGLYTWLRCDLQDLTIEEERNNYTRSDGYSIITNVRQFPVYTLQFWEMPTYIRRAIAVGLIDIFEINGRKYQKLNDESFAPQFQANPNSAMRILVKEVGDFVLSKNQLRSGRSSNICEQ